MPITSARIEITISPGLLLPAHLARGRALGAHDLAQRDASLGPQRERGLAQNLGTRLRVMPVSPRSERTALSRHRIPG